MTGPDRESSRQRDAQEAEWRSSEGERLLVCGIGASAGGLEAFERFLQKLPDDSGLAYVFAQHLDPQHKSLLAELLGRTTSIPVEFAKDGQPIERDRVYVMPQNAGLLVEDGKLVVMPGEPSSRLPINAFLTSLAEDQRENAIGIVLSGSGSDGALGIAAVKQHGGRTFAQLPADARYESMPQAAIASGAVDEVLPAEQIPAALARLVAERRQHPGESERGESEGLREAFEILGRKTGHDFSRYKRTTVLRRFHRRMAATGMATVRDYAALLDREEGEVHRLRDDLMINVTSFFRDGEPLQTLERVVIPDIMERRADGGVRAWVAGCSSGEEAYSIAMLFRERMERMARPPEVKIFATDIDASALAEGRRGRYTSAVERQVSPERLAQFFTKDDGTYTITKDVRDLCIFTEHDLLKDPPFSRMDLVSCRNLLIYLEPPLQQRIVELLHYALRPGGYLILGKAETIGTPDLFELVEKSDRLYRRREVERHPVPGIPPLPGPGGGGRASPLEMAPLARRSGAAVRSAADRSRNMVLEEYAPPSVVVDGHGEIRYYWGADLASYLPPQAGPPATNLLQLVRGELRVELSAALHSAGRQAKPILYKDRAVAVQGEERRLNLIVRPLPPTEGDSDDLFLVVFQQLHPGPAAQGAPLDAPTLERYRQLELDLENTRGRLQLTVDELENANEALRASNEELQSMNEELHSSNEELQTSQEELQSVNEELNTVNAELSKKVEELEILYGDLQNLFQSTQIATLFLDRQLRIARFTPQAKEVFRLADGDVGRPLADFAARFDAEGLSEEVERVMRTLEPADRSIRTLHDGRWFVMRMHPYRTPSNVIAGVVISFIDIVKLKAAESGLQEAVAERDATARAMIEADRRKDEFLAILSHELRNPLAPISSSLHILDRAPAGSDAARRAQQIIARQVSHLTRIVNDLLEVTRVARGKLQVERQRIDLRELVRRTSEDHRAMLSERHQALEVVLPERPVWVDGDATRLAQVLGNLLQNAAKFTPAEGSVRVSLEAVDRSAELRVRDTGVGIDPLVLPRLFQPFAQADRTLERREGGLGLGLALAKGLVELHGGTVEAHSAGEGAGAEFAVRLPLAAPPAPSAGTQPVIPRPRRILVIDDNSDAAESLRDALVLEGHEVETALDGPQGIAKARELAPDVVLCDIGLPGMDGYQVAKALREAPGPRRLYLVALSGYARPEDQERAKAAGFDAHIAKPPTNEQLQEAIARAPGRGSAPG